MQKLLIAIALTSIASAAAAEPPKAKAIAPAKPDPIVNVARDVLLASLANPQAQFRNVAARQTQNKAGEPLKVVCGEINTVNAYGSSTGFLPWIYLDNVKKARLYDRDDLLTTALLDEYCR
jgi:hypothetical protein